VNESNWEQLLGSLVIGEAVALPLTADAEGDLRRIHLAPRLTPHARHLAKYIDIPVPEGDQFLFWDGGRPSGQRARTLRQLVSVLEQWPTSALGGHLQRGDFSSWIANVFGDYPLAKTVGQLESDYRTGNVSEAIPNLVEAIRSRYDFVDPLSELHHESGS
jgi:hypothetical protein